MKTNYRLLIAQAEGLEQELRERGDDTAMWLWRFVRKDHVKVLLVVRDAYRAGPIAELELQDGHRAFKELERTLRFVSEQFRQAA
jgi:hypothetical protein